MCKTINKMKMLKLISIISCLPLLLLLHSCNNEPKKEDFIGKYHIDKTVPVDTTSTTLLKVKQTANWMISFEEHSNFELAGTGKSVVGYWGLEKINDKEYKLTLQGGGWTIFGRFDGTSMYFDKPYKMFDTLFSYVTFTRVRK